MASMAKPLKVSPDGDGANNTSCEFTDGSSLMLAIGRRGAGVPGGALAGIGNSRKISSVSFRGNGYNLDSRDELAESGMTSPLCS
jgi:hypothetical protein